MNKNTWLVEIRLKDWEPLFSDGLRVVGYEEVSAYNKVGAQFAGFKQFLARCGFEPEFRRRMESLGITHNNCCAPDAVVLND